MKATRLRRGQVWPVTLVWLCCWAAAWAAARCLAQDVVLSDFEQTNYDWLPGGTWTVTGASFGSGPAQGPLLNQLTVDGYLGQGLVDSYLGGDGSTGTLTSPPFTIQRDYIKFLIGGGSYFGAGGYGGQTCLELLVNGNVVDRAAGPGAWEHLDWEQWDVHSLLGQTARLEIVDSATGGWGHLNVDQLVESDVPLSTGVIVPTNQFINIPVKLGNPYQVVALLSNGLPIQEFSLPLGSGTNHDFYAFLDVSAEQNTPLVMRVDATNGLSSADFIQSGAPLAAVPVYQEALRPIYHFTPRRGFNNDPNGMVYFNGEYHLAYQHNPYDVVVGNQNWGQAVSTDLVRWTELPEALYGDPLGQIWSGSSVVDWNNSAGFGSNTLVSFYTSAGGHANNNLMSEGQVFSQSLAYSLDEGRTWIKYTNNPVVPNVAGDNRDPKVIWYAPGNKWVMVFWLQNNDFGFFSSTDLRHWTQTSTFTFPNVIEVPELFSMPLDGNTNNLQWIFYAGAGHYYVGQFDGQAFTAQSGPFTIRDGNSFAAGQTFNNLPAADGRRILVANSTGNYPNMPFNGGMDFPVELTLKTVGATPVIFVNPVRELAGLRLGTNAWPAQALINGVNVLNGASGEACELDVQFTPGGSAGVTLTLDGVPVVYDNARQQLSCEGLTNALSPVNGVITLQMLVDRGTLEIYADNGLVYMPMSTPPAAGAQPLSLVADGSGAQLLSLNLYPLDSAWPAAPPFISAQPGPPATVPAGSPVSFSVTASSTTVPLAYQWFNGGQLIVGATNATLAVASVRATNASYQVVVTNRGGAVTSSVAPLAVLGAYRVAYWRMESAITAPNNAGSPAFTGVADSDTASGEGIFTTGSLPAAIDDLIMFNGLAGNPLTLSTNVPPAAMLVNGHSGGSHSYNAEAITNVDGCLFFPQDQYGDEMDFTGPFSLEVFFQTDGDQSGSGVMQVLAQGTDTGQAFRYGVQLNAAGPGALSFQVANSVSNASVQVDLPEAHAADGQWHYLLAVCDPSGGANGQLRLTVVNPDGSELDASNPAPAGFFPLPAQNNGNLFLGRETYPVSQTPRTFRGCLDEVQITAGVVPDFWRIGRLPGRDNRPEISGVSSGAGGVSFQWSGAATSEFLVQWVARLGAAWQTIATLPSGAAAGAYVDTNPGHLAAPAGFYRILSR